MVENIKQTECERITTINHVVHRHPFHDIYFSNAALYPLSPLDFQGLVLMCVALLVCCVRCRDYHQSALITSGQRPSSISAPAMWRCSSSSNERRRPHSVYHFRYLSRPASKTTIYPIFSLTFFFFLVNAASTACSRLWSSTGRVTLRRQRCAITKVFLSAISIGIHHFFFFFFSSLLFLWRFVISRLDFYLIQHTHTHTQLSCWMNHRKFSMDTVDWEKSFWFLSIEIPSKDFLFLTR